MHILFQVLIVAVVVALLSVVVVIWRRTLPTDRIMLSANDGVAPPSPFNPLKSLTFEMLVNGDVSPTIMQEQAVVHVAKMIGSQGQAASNLMAQMQALNSQKDILVATFSKEVQKRLADGNLVLMQKEGGGKVLAAVTKYNGRIVEHGTVANAPMTAAKMANLTALVVSAAHMISGYDNAMRLRAIDKKIGSVIRLHENEMVGRLEAVFELLNERMSLGCQPEPATMLYLKLQLKELRGTWLRNLESALLDIETPEARSRVKKWFSQMFGLDKMQAKSVENAVSKQEINIHLIRVTIFLEQIIASAMGEAESFNQVTLVPIRAATDRIAKLMDDKKGYIAELSGQSPEAVASQSSLVKRLGESLGPQIDGDKHIKSV